MTISTIGSSLQDVREDMKLLPLPVLTQYLQNPQNMQADGVGFGLIAGAELARRKRVEDEAQASMQPNPTQIPTVAQGLMQGQSVGVGGVPVAKTGIAAFAQQPQQAQQQPQQITLSQPRQATPINIAAPYASPKTPLQQQASYAPSAPKRMAHGGIVAFSEGSKEPVPSTEDDPSLSLAERAKRTLARMRSGARDDSNTGLSLAERWNRPEGPPVSDVPYPKTAGTRMLASPVVLPATPATRPSSTASSNRASVAASARDTSAASAVPATSGLPSLADFNKEIAGYMKQIGEATPELSAERVAQVRKEAEDRLRGITDPRMAEIRRLQEEQSRIGSERDSGAFGRALMEAGLRGLEASSRPGSAAYALGVAGRAGLGAYEKEQATILDRAVKANQLKIALENDLMKQGLDRNTAANVAEEQARKMITETAQTKRATAKDLATLAVQKESTNLRGELKLQELALREQIANAQNHVRMLQASGATRDAEIAMLKLQNLMQHQQSLLLDRARDNVDKSIAGNIPLQMEINKNPGKLQQLYREEAARLGVKTADGTTAPTTGSAKFLGFEK